MSRVLSAHGAIKLVEALQEAATSAIQRAFTEGTDERVEYDGAGDDIDDRRLRLEMAISETIQRLGDELVNATAHAVDARTRAAGVIALNANEQRALHASLKDVMAQVETGNAQRLQLQEDLAQMRERLTNCQWKLHCREERIADLREALVRHQKIDKTTTSTDDDFAVHCTSPSASSSSLLSPSSPSESSASAMQHSLILPRLLHLSELCDNQVETLERPIEFSDF